MSTDQKKTIYKLHAEYCKALAHPVRLQIIDLLRQGAKSLENITEETGIKPSALSQHLTVLKQKGFISTTKQGRNVYCHMARPKILKACDIFQEVLREEIAEKKKLEKQVK